jgi:TrkA domain protein
MTYPPVTGSGKRRCVPGPTLRTRQDGFVDVEETALPGVGLRYDFATSAGQRIAVVSRRTGEQELVLYAHDDPDSARVVVPLTATEADALAELLGAPRIVERLSDLHRQVEQLVVEQMQVPAGSVYAGRPLGDTRARTRTGASIVAVVRGTQVHASPGPDFPLRGGDVLVVVGTNEGVRGVEEILARG